ncbi:MAG TPA: hypothetical protein VID07_04085, partial [Actinomycetes bacterium]
MRVGLDATPLLGPRTGVGRYVAGLAGALATLAGPEPEELALVPFSWRGTRDLPDGAGDLPAEVVAVERDVVRCMPLAHPDGLAAGGTVRATGGRLQVPVGTDLLGRVLDGLGRP